MIDNDSSSSQSSEEDEIMNTAPDLTKDRVPNSRKVESASRLPPVNDGMNTNSGEHEANSENMGTTSGLTPMMSGESQPNSEDLGTTPALTADFVRIFKIRPTDDGHEVWVDRSVLYEVASALFWDIITSTGS